MFPFIPHRLFPSEMVVSGGKRSECGSNMLQFNLDLGAIENAGCVVLQPPVL